MAKLNPDNHPTALDVMREKELKRKRELDGELDVDQDTTPFSVANMELPREGMKLKKQKIDRAENPTPSSSNYDAQLSSEKKSKSEKRKEKEQRKKEKRARKEEKRKAKQARKEATEREAEEQEEEQAAFSPSQQDDTFLDSVMGDVGPFDGSGLTDEQPGPSIGSASPSPPPDSTFSHASKLSASSTSTAPSLTSASVLPAFARAQEHLEIEAVSKRFTLDTLPGVSVFDHSQSTEETLQESFTSEHTFQEQSQVLITSATNTFTLDKLSTSEQPPMAEHESISDKPMAPGNGSKAKLTSEERDSAAQRLREKIAALRAARNADGPDGRPARSRQELIEARRKEQDARKQRKKDARKQSKEDSERAKAEAELALLRGSGSPVGSPAAVFGSRRSSPDRATVAFGRVAWADGAALGADGAALEAPRKTKGPSDPRSALEAARKKRERLAALDERKRADIEEKDAWLGAKKRARGERPRDDASLLKKALKRKDAQKVRSEKQWQERARAVEKGVQARQMKREENLRKRREEKGKKGKKVKRPGFEGSFRARPRVK